MRIIDLHIDGFGKFHDFSVTLQDGINIIYGANEAGKSTIHTFIRSMLFGMEPPSGIPSPSDIYSNYRPWDMGEIYKGTLRLEQFDQTYRLDRTFTKGKVSFKIFNETADQPVASTDEFMTQLLCGLTQISYDNTISIKQLKSATEDRMVPELKQYISNLNTSGNVALNVTKATEFLEQQKQDFEFQIVPEAAKNYTLLVSEISTIEKEIASPEYENQLSAFQQLEIDNRKIIELKQTEKDSLVLNVTQNKQVLDQNQFTDSRSITTYGEQVQQLYDDYIIIKQQSENTSRSLLSIFCIIFGALLLIGSVVLFILNAKVPSGQRTLITSQTTSFIMGGAAVLCFISSIFLRWWQNSLAKEVTLTAQVLQEIYSRHLGDNSVSEDAMKAMVKRIEEFHHISDSVTDCEKSIRVLTDELTNLLIEQDSCSEALKQQENTQRELEKKLTRLSTCKHQVDILKNVLLENDRIATEISSIDLALETLKTLSVSIRDSFGLHLNSAASELIRSITGGTYRSMNIDEDLNIYLFEHEKPIPMNQVSSGTLDQVYLALRLASSKLIQNEKDSLPLILDDSFVQYDDIRLKNTLTWINNVYPGQIILFTCHHREANFLIEDQIPYFHIQI